MARTKRKLDTTATEPIGGAGAAVDGIDVARDGGADSGESGSGAAGYINPASVAADNDSDNNPAGEPGKRKRGRPPGSRNTAAATKPADIGGVEKILFGIHMVLGNIIAPEFGMPKEECTEMAKAIQDVNRHYNIKLLDQKTADWFHLTQTVAVCYGVRIMAVRERYARERRPLQPIRTTSNIDGFTAPTHSEARTSDIPGLGKIEFPPDHPLAPRKVN
jgi:hypothetical protein